MTSAEFGVDSDLFTNDAKRFYAVQLRELMRHLSMKEFSEDWRADLGFIFWRETFGVEFWNVLAPFEKELLRFLADKSGGWWIQEQFVATPAFIVRYDEWRRSAAAQLPKTDLSKA